MLWVLKRTISMRRHFELPKHMFEPVDNKFHHKFMHKKFSYLNLCHNIWHSFMNYHGIDSGIETFIPIQVHITLEINLNCRIILVILNLIKLYFCIFEQTVTVICKCTKKKLSQWGTQKLTNVKTDVIQAKNKMSCFWQLYRRYFWGWGPTLILVYFEVFFYFRIIMNDFHAFSIEIILKWNLPT